MFNILFYINLSLLKNKFAPVSKSNISSGFVISITENSPFPLNFLVNVL